MLADPFGVPTFELAALQGIVSPAETAVEETVIALVQWLRLGVEVAGALVLGIGVLRAAVLFVREPVPSAGRRFVRIRLTLGHYLTLALELQLGADILSTAVAPTWDQIGKLGAIAVIRTALNFFLGRELREVGSAVAERGDEEPARFPAP